MQILIEQHCVIPFLLSLDSVPVFKAIQPGSRIVIGKIQIQVCGVQLLVDLFIDEICYLVVHCDTSFLKQEERSAAFVECSVRAAPSLILPHSVEKVKPLNRIDI